MARDIAALQSYKPQQGDSILSILTRSLARAVTPHLAGPVTGLASAPYLGTNTIPVINAQGFRGVAINLFVSAVAGVGTVQVRVRTNNNASMGSTATTLVTTTLGTASQSIIVYPGAVIGGSSISNVVSLPLMSYLELAVINSSAAGGNEVTCTLTYDLLV